VQFNFFFFLSNFFPQGEIRTSDLTDAIHICTLKDWDYFGSKVVAISKIDLTEQKLGQ
jgi:hypothetical protein